jgi:hypothetical protein
MNCEFELPETKPKIADFHNIIKILYAALQIKLRLLISAIKLRISRLKKPKLRILKLKKPKLRILKLKKSQLRIFNYVLQLKSFYKTQLQLLYIIIKSRRDFIVIYRSSIILKDIYKKIINKILILIINNKFILINLGSLTITRSSLGFSNFCDRNSFLCDRNSFLCDRNKFL